MQARLWVRPVYLPRHTSDDHRHIKAVFIYTVLSRTWLDPITSPTTRRCVSTNCIWSLQGLLVHLSGMMTINNKTGENKRLQGVLEKKFTLILHSYEKHRLIKHNRSNMRMKSFFSSLYLSLNRQSSQFHKSIS